MSFSSAVSTLEAVKACGTKRKEKDTLLAFNSANPALKGIFVHTYDWMRTYGIIVEDATGKDEPPAGEVREETWVNFVALCTSLASRGLTGSAARSAWDSFISSCTPKEAYWLTKVLNRDLKVGVAESTVAKIWPDALSPFDCQLATDMDKVKPKRVKKGEVPPPLFNFPLWVEPKLDGLRVLIVVDGDKATVHSRNGKELPGLEHFGRAFANDRPGRYVVDGEIFHEKWNSTISLTKTYVENLSDDEREQVKELIYYAFDWLPLDDFNKGCCSLPLEERRFRLSELINRVAETYPNLRVTTTDIKVVKSVEEIGPLFVEALAQGVEGVMVKDPSAPYEFGRGTHWLKIKPWKTVDGTIVGFENGKPGGKHEHVLGAFVVEVEGTGELVRVGGSMSDAQRLDFWNRRDELLGKMIEFKVTDDKAAVVVARFPQFVRFRPDKDKE